VHQKSDLGTADIYEPTRMYGCFLSKMVHMEAILGGGAQPRKEQSKLEHIFIFM